jgi:DNA-binding transcriptional ArsR family regulator
MKEESLFVQLLGDVPLIRVIDMLIENSIFDYTKTEIAKNAGISRASLYNVWPVLEKYELIKKSRRIGNAILYKLNKESPVVQKLIELDLRISKEFANSIVEKETSVVKVSQNKKR